MNDFGKNCCVGISANSLADIHAAIKDSSIETAFSTTGKLRNTTGHNLVWDDIFDTPKNYVTFFEQEMNAILHVISQKLIALHTGCRASRRACPQQDHRSQGGTELPSFRVQPSIRFLGLGSSSLSGSPMPPAARRDRSSAARAMVQRTPADSPTGFLARPAGILGDGHHVMHAAVVPHLVEIDHFFAAITPLGAQILHIHVVEMGASQITPCSSRNPLRWLSISCSNRAPIRPPTLQEIRPKRI